MAALAGSATNPLSALATGFRLPDQDAFATARGEAFAATADNPSAIYYNPAGITQLEGHQVRGGVYGLNLQVEYESPTGGSYDNQADLHAVPQFFYTYTPKSLPVAFGLGVYSPFGLSSKWPEDTGFRTIATRGRLTYLTINPVIALQITPTLSVAAGPTINFADTDLRQGFLTPTAGLGDSFRFDAHGWEPGFNAGILWKAHEKLQFGASYRSQTTTQLEGYTEFSSPVLNARLNAGADFAFPQVVIAGVSFRPTPAWNLEFNVDWAGWDHLNTVNIQQAVPPGVPLPPSLALPLNWDSSFYYEFGITRYLGKDWSVSAGYIFNENSVPDANYQPLVADLDRHFWSAGFGFRGDHFDFDFAYQFGYGPTRTVRGSAPSAFGQSADGDYSFLSHAILLTFGWRF